ncbi:MAG TPA: hypothetical protein VHR66_26495 [Gemmataceae bacterium]|jgi:hypothetical protein|nr:hypothetical protein [Gemmataceae bacterium]
MAVDATGLVQSTPTRVGDSSFQVRVTDGQSGSALLPQFTVWVRSLVGNQPPTTTSAPPAAAPVEQPYAHDLAGVDHEAEPLV